MENSMIVFCCVMAVLAVSVTVVFCVLAKWKRQTFAFESEETLPRLAKNFSVRLLIFNICILLMPIFSFLSLFIGLGLAFLCIYVGLILALISASVGLPVGLLGIVCSVVCARRKVRSGVGCVIMSSVSTAISLVLLLLYISLVF